MIRSQKIVETELKQVKNWEIGTTPMILKRIHHTDVNIAIYERDTSALTKEISVLIERNTELRFSGDIGTIMNEISTFLNPQKFSLLLRDIKELLLLCKEVANVNEFRFLLATVNTNMCRKFHTDINDVRMLCTYSGPGTLWLTDDNINQKALDACDENQGIAIEENRIQQAKTGSVVLLKGAIYPDEESKAVVHRSPTIEESGEKRLLLRIDTNETLNFWN